MSAPGTAAAFGVYVHFPFCTVRCPYCDFVTTDRDDLRALHRAGYVATVRREWALWRQAHPEIARMRLRSVFFGGGTPNLMTPGEIASVLDDLCGAAGEAGAGVEITVEMNPGVSGGDALRAMREAGVNRVSLGVQSTDDTLLRALGRDHTAADARRAFDDARAAGFTDINTDLIFAIPGQTEQGWRRTLREVAAWGPEHVCTYNLTAKDQTPLAARVRAGEIVLPGEETQHAMFLAAHRDLTAAGYEHVEVSNFARPGFACVHNGDVWRGVPYIGLGLGAHACFAGERSWNIAAWEDYHRTIAEGRRPRRVDVRDQAARRAEALYLGLRTRDGVPVDGLDLAKVTALTGERLAVEQGGRLRLTVEGWAVMDAIVATLL